MAWLPTSLAPARTVALRSSSEPAATCAAPANCSNILRTCSKLASAIDRMSLGFSKRSRAWSLMMRSLHRQGLCPDAVPVGFQLMNPLRAGCNPPSAADKRAAGLRLSAAKMTSRPAVPWTCNYRLAISNVPLTLSASGQPIFAADGDVVAMKDAELQWLASNDPRLAAYAASRLPAWLWTADGSGILWANPAGARLFGAADAAALAGKIFGPADRHRRQVARLAGRLLAGGAVRLERLQGFGAAPGGLVTCGCSRFDFPDGSHGVLVAAGNISLIGPRLAQAEPDNGMAPAAATSPTPPAEPVLSEPIPQPVAPQPAADDPQPAPLGEAPAGFALFDAFAEP